jgi:hypothetical protein
MITAETDGLSKLKGPAYAIRKKCVDCVADEYSEITRCTATSWVCKLWPYRNGHGREDGRDYERMSRLKAIRRECLLCMGNSSKEVEACDSTDCALYAYRAGKNPKRAGLGNKCPNTAGLQRARMPKVGP